MKFGRFKSSIIPQKIESFEDSEDILKEKKTSYSYLALSTAKVNKSDAYIVTAVSWSFDDVDEQYYAFWRISDAESCYNYFANFDINKVYNDTKSAIIEREDSVKHIPATSFKGFLVQEFYGGDFMKPFFDGKRVEKDGLMDELKSLIENLNAEEDCDIRKITGTKWEKYLLKFGEHDGVRIYYKDGEEDMNVLILDRYCWETGLNYTQIITRLKPDVFSEIKPFLKYHSEEIEEEGDWRGWFITDFSSVKKILDSNGYNILRHEG